MHSSQPESNRRRIVISIDKSNKKQKQGSDPNYESSFNANK